jgi:hypothetical protein
LHIKIFLYSCGDIFNYSSKKNNAANAALAPYLLPLTPQERRDLLKMGDAYLVRFFNISRGGGVR